MIQKLLIKITYSVFLFIFLNQNIYATLVVSGARKTILDPVTISESGEYFLGRNIDGTITLAANDIVLDLNNFIINGASTGISIDGVNNIFIKNGGIQNTAGIGISIENAENVFIADILIDRNAGSQGILITTATTITVDACTIRTNSRAIEMMDVSLVKIKNCIITNNRNEAIRGTNSNNISIDSCCIIDNDNTGIDFPMGISTLDITSCKINNNVLDGINVAASSFIRIDQCIIENNGAIGIDFLLTNSSIISACKVQGNGSSGINMSSSTNNVIIDCQSHQNTINGINLVSVSDSCIKKNITNGNVGTGISNSLGTNTVFFLNKAQLNGVANFSGLTPSPVSIFSFGAGGFVGTPGHFDNISVEA